MEDLLKKIEQYGLKKNLKKEEFLFHAGEEVKGFFFILSGEAKIYKMDEAGHELEISRISDKGFLGEAVIFSEAIYPVFAQASQDSSLLYFSKDKILEVLEKDLSINKLFLKLLAQKCLVLNQRIEILSLKSVRQRIAQYLLSKCKGAQCTVQLTIKKGELAKLLGTVHETLSRNFKQLRDEGMIEVNGSKIKIKDCAALKKELSVE
jgi:CRP/FNR family transcriptional regulator, dissimilatory nitrate respiration regulator